MSSNHALPLPLSDRLTEKYFAFAASIAARSVTDTACHPVVPPVISPAMVEATRAALASVTS